MEIGSIHMFAFNYAPMGFMTCDGSSILISENPMLYSRIENIYGGHPFSECRIPNMKGRIPVGTGKSNNLREWKLGQMRGSEYVTLKQQHLAKHNHTFYVSTETADSNSPEFALFSTTSKEDSIYIKKEELTNYKYMNPELISTIEDDENSTKHYNMMPSLAINYCIATMGSYTKRSTDQEEIDESLVNSRAFDIYIGEIRMFTTNYAPYGFIIADGKEIKFSDNAVLYSLLATNFSSTYQYAVIPDLRGCTAMHRGQAQDATNVNMGEYRGYKNIYLSKEQLPSHNHLLYIATDSATTNNSKIGEYLARALKGEGRSKTPIAMYTKDLNEKNKSLVMSSSALSYEGEDKSHENRQPSLVINYCIADDGDFPNRS